MWAIKNYTPYAVKKTWGRDKEGVHEWIVAVKATFDIHSDSNLELANKQVEPLILPEYNGEAGVSSLRYDADLVSPKPTTDIVLNGTAYAPEGRPSKKFSVGLRVGPVKKTIQVVGNRRWERGLFGLKLSPMEPVTEVPIVYERAYGGFDQTNPNPKKQRMDSRNPVGCGVEASAKNREGQPMPNFKYPMRSFKRGGPAGFGAIDSYWSPRRELNGTYNEVWKKSRYPLLPKDWDPHSLLCSPPDQRPDKHLRGGEQVELINLTPGGLLRFTLPKVYLFFRTRFVTRFGVRIEEHRSRLVTVIIEPDYPRIFMVWHSWLAVHTDGDYLEETIVREKRYI